jgi:hypothetical protein
MGRVYDADALKGTGHGCFLGFSSERFEQNAIAYEGVDLSFGHAASGQKRRAILPKPRRWPTKRCIATRKAIQEHLEGQEKPADTFAHEPFTETQMQLMY